MDEDWFGGTGGAAPVGNEGGADGGTDGAEGGAEGGIEGGMEGAATGGDGVLLDGTAIPGIPNAGGTFSCICGLDVGGIGGTGGAEDTAGAGGVGVLILDTGLGDDLCVFLIISSNSGFPLGAGALGIAGADGADAATCSCSTGALVGADAFLATALSSTTNASFLLSLISAKNGNPPATGAGVEDFFGLGALPNDGGGGGPGGGGADDDENEGGGGAGGAGGAADVGRAGAFGAPKAGGGAGGAGGAADVGRAGAFGAPKVGGGAGGAADVGSAGAFGALNLGTDGTDDVGRDGGAPGTGGGPLGNGGVPKGAAEEEEETAGLLEGSLGLDFPEAMEANELDESVLLCEPEGMFNLCVGIDGVDDFIFGG